MGDCAGLRSYGEYRRCFFYLALYFGNALPGSLCFELEVGKLFLLLIHLGLLGDVRLSLWGWRRWPGIRE